MADFNQVTTNPTQTGQDPFFGVHEAGAHNFGFRISPTYVNASEFAVAYNQVSPGVKQQEIAVGAIGYLFAKPTDSRVVPMRAPLPTEIATRTVVATVSVGTENPDLFDLYYFEN